MNKIKIFHLINNYRGNNPLLNAMILGLDDRFDANICYLSGSPDGKNILDRYGKSRYLDVGITKSKLTVIRELTRLLKSEQPDILHCHRHKTTLVGTIAAIFSGIPHVVSHVHGMNRTRTVRTRLINWLLLRHTALIIGVSESVRKDVLITNWGLLPQKVVTVWNGIEVSPIDTVSQNRKRARMKMGVPESAFVFGSVGRLVQTKGHEYLLKAFSKIREQGLDATVVIIGDGPLRKDLEAQAREAGIQEHVVFAGYRTDVLELLPGFDVFVLPSIAEGLSLALLEAMASKLPVIASDVGGIPEVFGDEEIGRLVPSKNTAALGDAMREIYALDEKRKAVLGENARKRIESEFNIDIMRRRLAGLYESLLKTDKG